MPDTVQDFDADGTTLVYELHTPLWGETEAGFEWDVELHARLTRMGWAPCEGVPAMYYFNGTDSDARLVKIVDDLCISEKMDSSRPAYRPITDNTIKQLQEQYGTDGLTFEHEPTSFAGFKISRSADFTQLTISQPQKILDAVRDYMPELLTDDKVPSHVVKGEPLKKLIEDMQLPANRPSKLSSAQKLTQRKIGSLKYPERGTHPELTRAVHRLSCVMSCPPPEAAIVADSLIVYAYKHRNRGITYGKLASDRDLSLAANAFRLEEHKAPDALSASADANAAGKGTVYSNLLTYNGGSVLHATKNVGIAVTSTHDAESVATLKMAEWVVYARIALRALGVDPGGPTIIGTDNLANERVCNNAQSASRSRHFLIRYAAVQRYIAQGDVAVQHIPDAENPSDFLTKWVGKRKLQASLRYACNVPPTVHVCSSPSDAQTLGAVRAGGVRAPANTNG